MAEYAVRPRERTRAPSHPGRTVRASVEAMGLSMVKVSAALGVSRQALYNITRDKNHPCQAGTGNGGGVSYFDLTPLAAAIFVQGEGGAWQAI